MLCLHTFQKDVNRQSYSERDVEWNDKVITIFWYGDDNVDWGMGSLYIYGCMLCRESEVSEHNNMKFTIFRRVINIFPTFYTCLGGYMVWRDGIYIFVRYICHHSNFIPNHFASSASTLSTSSLYSMDYVMLLCVFEYVRSLYRQFLYAFSTHPPFIGMII